MSDQTIDGCKQRESGTRLISNIEKLVTISAVPDQERSLFNLNTVDGLLSLADRLQKDIDEWCAEAFDDGPRSHLGASQIGAICDRHIWYGFHWFKHKKHSGRMQRLFQDGHRYEDRLIEMLRGIGCTYWQVDPETGEQFQISAVEGHFSGSTDGCLVLPERYGNFPVFNGEFKTANKDNFAKFHDVENSKAQHWAQICVYGYLRRIEYAIYFLVGKNDADMKIEIVKLDWDHAQAMLNKAQFIILSPTPPMKISGNPSDYRCKMCDHWKVCQLGEAPDVNCRTCVHSQPIEGKMWRCNLHNIVIPGKAEALAGCPSHVGRVC